MGTDWLSEELARWPPPGVTQYPITAVESHGSYALSVIKSRHSNDIAPNSVGLRLFPREN